MNIIYTKKDNTITHFYDGIKKYEHFKDSKGYETWTEYDKEGNEIHYKDSKGYETWTEYNKEGNEIHYKDSDGDERWSDDNPDKPKNRPIVDDCEPFSFGG